MDPPAPSLSLARLPVGGKIALAAGLSLVVLLAYWFVFYSDVATKIDVAKRQKTALRGDLAREKQAEASYFEDRADLALHEQRAQDLNKALPPDAEEDAFLSSVQEASNAAGIDLESYAPTEEVTQSFYAKVPMRLSLVGKFHQIAKFAYELGKMDRIINVENIELTNPAVAGDEVVLHGRCLATAFHAVAPKISAASQRAK